jgi:hypothetical protein
MSDGQDFATFEQQAGEPDTPEVQEEEVVEQPETPEEPEEGAEEAPEAEEQPEEAPKPKPTVQARIDEITRARREAEREARYWRDVAEGRTKPHDAREPAKEEAKAPDPGTYELGDIDPRYIDDLVNFRVQQGLDKVMPAVAQNLQRQAGERVWEASQEQARSKFADYDAKVIDGAHNWPCTQEMAEAIRTSDAGGELAYHLASHPDEARRITALPPIAQVRELGRIEARLETPKAPPKPTTNAPKPPEGQARGQGGKFAPSAATTNFAEFEALANRKGG